METHVFINAFFLALCFQRGNLPSALLLFLAVVRAMMCPRQRPVEAWTVFSAKPA